MRAIDTFDIGKKAKIVGFSDEQTEFLVETVNVIESTHISNLATKNEILLIEERINGKIDQVDNKIDQVEEKLNSRIDQIDNKIDQVEERLNSRIDQIDNKIDQVEERLNSKIDQVEEKLNGKIDKIKNDLTIRMGIMLATSIAIITWLDKVIIN